MLDEKTLARLKDLAAAVADPACDCEDRAWWQALLSVAEHIEDYARVHFISEYEREVKDAHDSFEEWRADHAVEYAYPDTWEVYVRGLSDAKREQLLINLLDWQLNELGRNSDLRFKTTYEDEDTRKQPAMIYWEATGVNILDT